MTHSAKLLYFYHLNQQFLVPNTCMVKWSIAVWLEEPLSHISIHHNSILTLGADSVVSARSPCDCGDFLHCFGPDGVTGHVPMTIYMKEHLSHRRWRRAQWSASITAVRSHLHPEQFNALGSWFKAWIYPASEMILICFTKGQRQMLSHWNMNIAGTYMSGC